jgi:hypothetical protein
MQDTDAAAIVLKINETKILESVVKTAGSFSKATREIYNTTINELAYDHDPDPASGKNEHVSLWDSSNWVSTFRNLNPNFELKSEDFVNIKRGMVEIALKLENKLQPGKYFMTLGAHLSDGLTLEYLENILELNVLNVGINNQNGLIYDFKLGYYRANCKWQITQ